MKIGKHKPEAGSEKERSRSSRMREWLVLRYPGIRSFLFGVSVALGLQTMHSKAAEDLYACIKAHVGLFDSKISVTYASPSPVPINPVPSHKASAPSAPFQAATHYLADGIVRNDDYRDGKNVEFTIEAPEGCRLSNPSVRTWPLKQAPFMHLEESEIPGMPEIRKWQIGFFPKNLTLSVEYTVTCAEIPSDARLRVTVSPEACVPHATSKLRPISWHPTGTHVFLHDIDFSPYENGQDPNIDPNVDIQQITERIRVIAPYTQWVRLSSNTTGLNSIPPVVDSMGLKVAAGAWISSNMTYNDHEIANLIAAANAGTTDIAIIGSEVVQRGEISDDLVRYSSNVRKNIFPKIPITPARTGAQLMRAKNGAAGVAATDVVFANIYPYWEGRSRMVPRHIDSYFDDARDISALSCYARVGMDLSGTDLGGMFNRPLLFSRDTKTATLSVGDISRCSSAGNDENSFSAFPNIVTTATAQVACVDIGYSKPLVARILSSGGAHLQVAATVRAFDVEGRSPYGTSLARSTLTVRVLKDGGAHLSADTAYYDSAGQKISRPATPVRREPQTREHI